MSCAADCETGRKCCCGDSLSPCKVCAENTKENETLQSALDNFITNFFGALVKTEVNGVVTWILPCGLETGLQNNPRLTDEGLACYFLRLFKDGITGLTGPRGLEGDPGIDGKSGVTYTSASFIQPVEISTDVFSCPTFDIAVLDASLLVAGMYVWIPGSGYYQIVQVTGNTVTVTIIVAVAGPNPVTIAGTVVIPAGPRGSQGKQGIPGGTGSPGTNGGKGDKGDQGDPGVSARAKLLTPFTYGGGTQGMPAAAANTDTMEFDLELGLTVGQYLWVGGAGYMRVVVVVSPTQATLQNLGISGVNVPQNTLVPPWGPVDVGGFPGASTAAWVYVATFPPSATDYSLLSWKTRAGLVSGKANIAALSGHMVIDGVNTNTLAARTGAQRVLVAAQTDPKENGLYDVVTPGAWTRCPDADSGAKLAPGTKVQIAYGGTFSDTEWVMLDQTGTYDPTNFATQDKTFVQSNAFVPAYGVVDYRSPNGYTPLSNPGMGYVPGMVTATTLQGRWFEIGTGGAAHWRTPDLANVDITSPAPANPKAQFKITIPGTYLVSWNAECWSNGNGALGAGGADSNHVFLGVLKKAGGGSFAVSTVQQVAMGGGILPPILTNNGLTLAGSGLFVDLKVNDEIQLMAWNHTSGNQFFINNACFHAQRLL